MKTLWTNRRYVVIDDFTNIVSNFITFFLLENDEDIEDILDEVMADFEEENVIKAKVRIQCIKH